MTIDWENIREECAQTGKFIKIMKQGPIEFPIDFHESNMGLSKGAIRQYRDDRPTQSLHVHEFPDYFLAHVDTFNPEHHPIAHGITDTPGMAIGIVLGAIGIYFLAKTIKNLTSVPDESELL